jgi:molybdate/tungstate transport system substrate-binding protein
MMVRILALAAALVLVSCKRKSETDASKNNPKGGLSGKLIVFHAGSLSVPFKKISEAFRKEHPNVTILLEASGSRTCARKITEMNRPCDVMASADYTVIDKLLIPEHADWNIKLATNEMTIVYHKGSKRSEEITKDNWYQVLMDETVRFGRSNPNADPCGYRAVLTMKLAGEFYKDNSIADKLLAKDHRFIRPKETDLLALLESNTIDYIFLYRSVAQQHGLEFVVLPDEVNLKKAELADFYKNATVEISGKKPGDKITKTGAPMVYGITIPKNSSNPAVAKAFVRFVLSKDKGMKILEAQGQPSAVPSPTDTFDAIPGELKTYATKPFQRQR